MPTVYTHEIPTYLDEVDAIYRSGAATEHSYRPALKTLLEALFETMHFSACGKLTITNEPKRIECGAPDYIVTRGPIPLGYIEAKDIPVGIHDKASQSQFERYKEALPNLIITNYIDFELFTDGELTASASIAAFDGKTITPDTSHYAPFLALIEAFAGYRGKTLPNTEALAHIMAGRTRLLAATIANALASSRGDDNDPIRAQLAGFRQILIHDLGEGEFADIYAQTLAYGMFAARLNDRTSEPFTRKKAADLIPLSNPFLRKFFYFIAGDLDARIAWIVDALADMFNCVSVEDILTEFSRQGQDPYIHFYETFLAEYDPRLRESRGVYYTPVPVVRFIVRAVDDILQSGFGLPRGLADNSKVTRDGKEFHRVQILDPAAGTGTFLAEVIDQIYAKFANQKGAWPLYCKENLIPRLAGFEILMASYAMAHLKLGMKLHETNYSGEERLRVYLTNSLDEPKTEVAALPFVQWLSTEASEANALKRDVPVLVVIANPPYNVSTQNRNPWIDGLIGDYKTGLEEANIQPLSDDYIKFIRFGQYLVEKNQSGVLAYICNNSFVDGLIHRKMRETLMGCFDRIYLLNLHGNARKKETAPGGGKDENVFAIQQGVCIAVFIKTGKKKPADAAQVFYHDLYGRRKAKYAYVQEHTLDAIPWERLDPAAPHYFFVPKNFSGQEVYEKGFSVRELFPFYANGLKTHRDDASIKFTKKECKDIADAFLRLANHELTEQYGFRDTRDWTIDGARRDLKNNKIIADRIAYRPFDIRFMNYTGKTKGVMSYPRFEVMRHLMQENIALCTCRQQSTFKFQHILVTTNIAESCFVSSQGGEGAYIFPLYLYPEEDGLDQAASRTPNLNMAIVAEIEKRTGLAFTPEYGQGAPCPDTAFAPIDLLDYIYAVLHSVKYRTLYAEFLKIDFPRVPYPQSAGAFQRLAAFGAALRRLHLLDGVNPAQDYAAFPAAGDNIIEKTEYRGRNVFINEKQYFENVPPEVWEFYSGGYQSAQKWLKDRKGRAIDFDGIEHYQKIITALKLTIDLQEQIDGAFL